MILTTNRKKSRRITEKLLKKKIAFCFFKKTKVYTCVRYFIDQKGNVQPSHDASRQVESLANNRAKVQVMHLDEFLAMSRWQPQAKDQKYQRDERILIKSTIYINHKIAHPSMLKKDNLEVRVTYIKNMLSYEEVY